MSADWKHSLESDFCPPLDTALVAALLADYDDPDDDTITSLRSQLSDLASDAAIQQAQDAEADIIRDLGDLRLTARSTTTTEDSSGRDYDSMFGNPSPESCSESSLSSGANGNASGSNGTTPGNPALAFLRASFPNISAHDLKHRLRLEEDSNGEIDMQKLVEDLLSEEYVRDLEERGLSDDAGNSDEWSLVTSRPKPKHQQRKNVTKKKGKAKTIALNDVRQQHHNVPKPSSHNAGDPWSQVSSISSYLSTLLPQPPTFFSSYFHKPEFSSPASALRAALRNISPDLDDEDLMSGFVAFWDFVISSPEYDFENLGPAAKELLCADAELSLKSVAGVADVALDVLSLLWELEGDGGGRKVMGLYHAPTYPTTSKADKPRKPKTLIIRPVASTSASPISPAYSPAKPSPSSSSASSPSTINAWQEIPIRVKAPTTHPLAAHIPAYNPSNVPRRKSRLPPLSSPSTPTSANSFRSPRDSSNRSTSVLGSYKSRIEAARERRGDALRAASRYWSGKSGGNGGGGKSRGGEVALYYAMEAQKAREEARALEMDAVRELVGKKRQASTNQDTIDVHYCTAPEALTLVQEVLEEGWVTASRPLKVITGRGLHSNGGVAVLGPTLVRTLEAKGWRVGKWEGGVSVRGRG